MFTYWHGMDQTTGIPVVIHEYAADSGLFYSAGFTDKGRSFLWFEKRYGPLKRMDVLPVDGYGEVIDNESRKPYRVDREGDKYLVVPRNDRVLIMLATDDVAEAIAFRDTMNRKAGFQK